MSLKTLLLGSAGALAMVSTANASNLIVNGGFESGDFSGFSTGFSGGTDPVIIAYGQASGYPTGAFGEAVPAPPGGGMYGAYFSSDTGFDQIAPGACCDSRQIHV